MKKDVFKDKDITIFPNPANNHLKVISKIQQITTVEIIDLSGRIIKTVEVNGNNMLIEVESMKSGVFILKVNNEIGSVSKKFIKK